MFYGNQYDITFQTFKTPSKILFFQTFKYKIMFVIILKCPNENKIFIGDNSCTGYRFFEPILFK
jgi:hypothetical protein